jgi:cytochrome d ubiquinol oxidase subunit I
MEVTYWGFRAMIGFGGLAALAALVALIITRKGTVPESRWLMRLAVVGILAPFGANAAGWIFTEMGRQPFVVAPNPSMAGSVDQVFMFTAAAVSPGVSAGEILTSLIVLTLVYAALMVVEVRLLWTYTRGGVASAMPELAHAARGDDEKHDDASGPGGEGAPKPADDVLAFAY